MEITLAWVWLGAAWLALLALERFVNRHLQGLFLLVLRDPNAALAAYALVMLPGVFIHETSHWMVGSLLGARPRKFSVWPQRQKNGTVRLGYVEMRRTDFIREALIGAAPLVFGSLIIGAVGAYALDIGPLGAALAAGDVGRALARLEAMTQANDFWLWVYVLFALGNTMLPSASDRQAWLPLGVAVMALAGVLAYLGLSALLWDALTGPALALARGLAASFTLAAAVNALAAPVLWGVEKLTSKALGYEIRYD